MKEDMGRCLDEAKLLLAILKNADGHHTEEEVIDIVYIETGISKDEIKKNLLKLLFEGIVQSSPSITDSNILDIQPVNDSKPFFRTPSKIALNITCECNLDCLHCYFPKHLKEITINDWEHIIDDLASNYVSELMFIGGEPLLNPNFKKITTYAANKNKFYLRVSTNGTLINKSMAKHIVSIQIRPKITLLGPEIIHDRLTNTPCSFKKTIKGIYNLLQEGCEKIIIQSVATKINSAYLIDLIDYIGNLSIKSNTEFSIKLSPVWPIGSAIHYHNDLYITPEEFLETVNMIYKHISVNNHPMYGRFRPLRYLSALPKHPLNNAKRSTNEYPYIECDAGFSYMEILPDGRVIPCFAFLRFPDYISIEKIHNIGLKEIWTTSKIFKDLRKTKYLKKNINKGLCEKCKFTIPCGRGCRALALLNGGIDYNDPWCRVYTE